MCTQRNDRRRARLAGTAATAVVIALALAGCQSLRDGDAGPDTGDVTPGGTVETSAPLLQVRSAGGFVMWGYDFATPPTLTVYPDGRAIVPGPQIAIYPGPALPNLLEVQLSDADVDALVEAAADAGLLAEAPSYGMPPVTDLPTTYVTLTVDGRAYEHAAYALGFLEGEGSGEGAMTGADSGLSDDEAATRVVLAGFVGRAIELADGAGSGESYAIDALGIMATPAATLDATAVDGLEPQVVPWPVDVPLAGAAECALVDGDAAVTLLAALADANAETRFEQDGVEYTAWFRPLLPGETGCGDLV